MSGAQKISLYFTEQIRICKENIENWKDETVHPIGFPAKEVEFQIGYWAGKLAALEEIQKMLRKLYE